MIQKVFLTKSGKAEFSCPECSKRKQMDISKFINVNKEIRLKITCKCSHIFSVILERRKHLRIDVHLPGVLIAGTQQFPVIVKDISKQGLKIKTKKILNLNIDDKITIKFVLDDAQKSKVSKDIIIKKMDKTYIGTKFVSGEHYDKFGAYLLFN